MTAAMTAAWDPAQWLESIVGQGNGVGDHAHLLSTYGLRREEDFLLLHAEDVEAMRAQFLAAGMPQLYVNAICRAMHKKRQPGDTILGPNGADLPSHFDLVAAQGGAGDSAPAANRGRKWFQHARVTGWECAQEMLVRLSDAQVQGAAWRQGKVSETEVHVVYNFRCPFHSTHWCPWEVRVRILKTQPTSGAGGTIRVRMCKDSEDRKKEHAQHVCDVELDEKYPHTDHTAFQKSGPHQFWVCAAEGNPMMYEWDSNTIRQWLTTKNVKFGGGNDKNNALKRILRHNRTKRAKEKEEAQGAAGSAPPPRHATEIKTRLKKAQRAAAAEAYKY